MKKLLFFIIISLINISNIFGQRTITIDGNASDWQGTDPSSGHQTTYSNGEFIYKGVANDERTDYDGTQESSDNDITEFRVATDGTWLYLLIKMRDITNVDYPHICLVFTNGSSSQSFIGDDSKRSNTNGGGATPLGLSSQYGRLVDIHSTSSNSPTIEMYDGGSWYAPPTSGYGVVISTANDVIEAKISLGDLGLSSTSTTKISFMTAPNRVGWNNDIDGTAWGTDNVTNGVDVMTPGASSGSSAWDRDLNNGDVGYYAEVNLANAPLPVELASFSASYFNGGVTLVWKTATEINNYGWEIERSKIDEKTNKPSVWEKVGFVKGSGNSNSPKEYSFIDTKALYGYYAYRLRQIDVDGSASYSSEVRVFAGSKPQVYDVKNYPNPFNPQTTIRFELPEAGNVKLAIYDITGQLVKVLVDEWMPEGIHEKIFDGSQLASGIYISVLQAKDVRVVKKMQLIK